MSENSRQIRGLLLVFSIATSFSGVSLFIVQNPLVVCLAAGVAVAALVTLVVREGGALCGIRNRGALEKAGMVLGGSIALFGAVWASIEIQRPRWRPYASPDGRWSVELPCEPRDIGRDQPMAGGGKVTVHAIECRPRFTAWSYGVSWLDRPDAAAAKEPAKVLEGIEKETLEKLKGTLVASVAVPVEGGVARQFELKVERRRVVERYYLVRSRLYFLLVDAPETDIETGGGERTRHFLGSFQLAK